MVIRGAAAEHSTRMGALQAMQQEASRLKEAAEHEAGGIVAARHGYRARVQFTDGDGAAREIQGPRRHDERRAKADLEVIRAAGTSKPTRAEALEAMGAEAHRLQEHAGFEAEVAMAVGKERLNQKHTVSDSDPESEGNNKTEEPDEDPFP